MSEEQSSKPVKPVTVQEYYGSLSVSEFERQLQERWASGFGEGVAWALRSIEASASRMTSPHWMASKDTKDRHTNAVRAVMRAIEERIR